MTEKNWTNEELFAALQSYLFLLSSQVHGITVDKNQVIEKLLKTSLRERNRAAVRYRFRNFSHIFLKDNYVTLKGYTPASQVGPKVEIRIRNILTQYPEDFLRQFLVSSNMKMDSFVISEQIDELRKKLKDLDARRQMRGHNNPPELIDDIRIPDDLFREITQIVDNYDAHEAQSDALKKAEKVRVKLWDWITLRFTKFIDTLIYVSTPIILAKIFGMSEILSRLSGLLELL